MFRSQPIANQNTPPIARQPAKSDQPAAFTKAELRQIIMELMG